MPASTCLLVASLNLNFDSERLEERIDLIVAELEQLHPLCHRNCFAEVRRTPISPSVDRKVSETSCCSIPLGVAIVIDPPDAEPPARQNDLKPLILLVGIRGTG